MQEKRNEEFQIQVHARPSILPFGDIVVSSNIGYTTRIKSKFYSSLELAAEAVENALKNLRILSVSKRSIVNQLISEKKCKKRPKQAVVSTLNKLHDNFRLKLNYVDLKHDWDISFREVAQKESRKALNVMVIDETAVSLFEDILKHFGGVHYPSIEPKHVLLKQANCRETITSTQFCLALEYCVSLLTDQRTRERTLDPMQLRRKNSS